MNHVPGIGESHAIAAAVGLDDRAGCLVGFVPRPVTLKLKQDLDPAGEVRARSFHAPKCEFVAGQGEASAGVCHDKYLVSALEGGEHRKGNTRFRQEPGNDESFPFRSQNGAPSGFIFPNVHVSTLNRLDALQYYLQARKERATVDL